MNPSMGFVGMVFGDGFRLPFLNIHPVEYLFLRSSGFSYWLFDFSFLFSFSFFA